MKETYKKSTDNSYKTLKPEKRASQIAKHVPQYLNIDIDPTTYFILWMAGMACNIMNGRNGMQDAKNVHPWK